MRTGDSRGEEPYRVQPYFRRMRRFLRNVANQAIYRGRRIDANRISGPQIPGTAFGEFRMEGGAGMIRMTPGGHP